VKTYVIEYEVDGVRRSEVKRASSARAVVSDLKRRRPNATFLGVRWG